MQRWFLFILKLGSIFATFGLAALVAYGFAFTWQVADDALREFRGSPRLLVGFSYESTSINGHSTVSESHTYIIVPSVLQTLATVEVTKDDRGVRTEVQRFGAVEILGVFLMGLVGLWWFFIHRRVPASSSGGRV
jgi:hypothetical protein